MMFSCLISLVVLAATAEGSLHLLKVHVPSVLGGDENADFRAIDNILDTASDDSDVTIVLSIKEVGNPLAFAVLDITDDLKWIDITKQLFAKGYHYTSIPMYSCEDFASELNVSMTVTTTFTSDIKHFVHLTFPTYGLTEAAYNARMADFLQHVSTTFAQSGWEMTCFRETIEVPYEMFFFTNEPDSADFDLATVMKAGEQFHVKLSKVQKLDTYVAALP